MKLILASASPRRQKLIRMIDPNAVFLPADADETVTGNVSVWDRPALLAVRKGEIIAKQHPDCLVLGCDTSVIAGDAILGKPRDKEDARRMLSLLSGRTHSVVTGCALFYREKRHIFSERTEVTFYPLTEKEILDYIETDEPMDKAGAYGIQGLGGLFVKGINGDYTNVVGLPTARLKREIAFFMQKAGS